MVRKLDSRIQQFIFKCEYCDFISKQNSYFILHNKEKHGIEL